MRQRIAPSVTFIYEATGWKPFNISAGSTHDALVQALGEIKELKDTVIENNVTPGVSM